MEEKIGRQRRWQLTNDEWNCKWQNVQVEWLASCDGCFFFSLHEIRLDRINFRHFSISIFHLTTKWNAEDWHSHTWTSQCQSLVKVIQLTVDEYTLAHAHTHTIRMLWQAKPRRWNGKLNPTEYFCRSHRPHLFTRSIDGGDTIRCFDKKNVNQDEAEEADKKSVFLWKDSIDWKTDTFTTYLFINFLVFNFGPRARNFEMKSIWMLSWAERLWEFQITKMWRRRRNILRSQLFSTGEHNCTWRQCKRRQRPTDERMRMTIRRCSRWNEPVRIAPFKRIS